MPRVIMESVVIAKCRYEKCHYAKRRYAKCHYPECRGALFDLFKELSVQTGNSSAIDIAADIQKEPG
jgi:hypothetical protein